MDAYAVFRNNQAVGQAVVTKDGLYWLVDAVCALLPEAPLRLYAQTGAVRVCLGVPAPENGKIVLRRRLSARSAAFSPDTRLYLAEDAEHSDPSVSGAQLRGNTLSAAYREGEPPPMLEHFRAFRLESRDGGLWWTAELDERGVPMESQHLSPERNAVSAKIPRA